MKPNNYDFFQNRQCAYYPCHDTQSDDFNCLFCYCPLYALGDQCGGHFVYTSRGIKDCSGCLIPHSPGGYTYVLSKFDRIAELASRNREDNR